MGDKEVLCFWVFFSRPSLPCGTMAYYQQQPMMSQPMYQPMAQPMYQPMMAPMPSVDYSQGKWFAPGEPLPPGFVAVAHPDGVTEPLDTHAMSELVKSSGSFVVTGMSTAPAATAAAAAIETASKTLTASAAKKSK